MAKKSNPSAMHIRSLRTLLHEHFRPAHKPEARSTIVRELYNKYKERMSKPKLTTANLIRCLRYIERHHISEDQYDEVIKKAPNHKSVLRMSDFNDIYKMIMQKSHAENQLNDDKLDDIFNWIFQAIIDAVDSGGSACVRRFGKFECFWVKSRIFKIPKTHKKERVKGHISPKFRPSILWRRALRH